MESQPALSRQALFIPLAKVWFIICSFAMQVLLPNLLEADQYGDFGVVNRGISVINMIMVTGSIQAVSKFVSEDGHSARAIRSTALRIQLFFGGGLALAYFLAAPAIANGFRDPSLTGFIRISAAIPACYAFYAVYIGTLNGLRRFRAQGLFDMAYATMRCGGILGAAWLGFGVGGVFVAFASAAAIILVLAFLHGRTVDGSDSATFPASRLIGFATPVVAFVLVNQLLLSADLFLAKRMLDPEVSAELAGAYVGMLNLAMLPYMLVVSVNFIVFPLISRSTFIEDAESTKSYITQSLRITLLLTLLAESVPFGSPEQSLGFLYWTKPEFGDYPGAMMLLAVAYTAFTLFSVTTTIINGSGKPKISLIAGACVLTGQVAIAWFLIPSMGLGGAALATAIAFTIGTAGLGIFLVRKHGAFLAPLTVVRGLIAAGASYGVGQVLNIGGFAFLGEAIVCAIVFIAALILTGELGKADLDRVLQIVRRRG